MLKFIIKRFLQAIPTLWLLITISFFIMRLAPGSPFSSERNFSPQIMANIEAKYHFNEPLYKQYLMYLNGLLHGDLGPSFKYKDHSVNELVDEAFPVSIKLGIIAFVVAVVIGVGIGILAALNQNRWIDYTVMSFAMVGIVIPNFVKAPLLVILFSLYLKWLPAGGWNDGSISYLILPVLSLSISYIANISRIMRSSMIEVLSSNFIRTAQAKGLPQFYIILHHALKPAMLPIISYLAPAFVGIITGSVVIETIFGIPGIGQLFVNGSLNRDYSMVVSLTVIIGVLTILTTAIADILYAFIDPKIRY